MMAYEGGDFLLVYSKKSEDLKGASKDSKKTAESGNEDAAKLLEEHCQ